MKVFRGIPYIQARRACALVIGNFDGVHAGHKSMLSQVRAAATRLNIDAAVMTFQPHPREYFAKVSGRETDAPQTISNLRNKLTAFSGEGIDRVFVMPFTSEFANLSKDVFVKDLLVNGAQAKWLMVGEDFSFGAQREGGAKDLLIAGKEYHFDANILPNVTLKNGERISSSAVRKALRDGDFPRATAMLDAPYHISGRVAHGQKLGRQLGFPTVNLPMRQANPALSGIFVTRIYGLSDQPLASVSCIGARPTVCVDGSPILEVHILDYAQSCYGKKVCVEFLHKLRDNQKFPDIAALKAAIQQDVDNARAYFQKIDSEMPLNE